MPTYRAKLAALVEDPFLLGGAGSGNFGHAGVEGQQGGSAPSGTGHTVFHGTSEQSLPGILKDGLKVSHSGTVWPTESQRDHVYVTTDEDTALEWASYAAQHAAIADPGARRAAPPPVVIIKIRVPPDQRARVARDAHQGGASTTNQQFKGDIPPEWIIGAKIGRPSKPDATVWDVEYAWEDVHLRVEAGQILYVVLVGKSPTVKTDPVSLGGAGSGNFGHKGRPGEVGGSGDSGDSSASDKGEHGHWEKAEGGKEYWVGGGTPTEEIVPRKFKGDEGYDWHERPEMEDYVKGLPRDEVEAVNSYAGFSYGDINQMLRGSYKAPIVDEYVREATPEEIAQYKPQYRSGKAKDYDPDDPTNKVEDGRIIRSREDPVTGKWGDEVKHYISRAVPDQARIAEIEGKTEKINALIAERGYALPEPMEVHRAAYIPGLTFDDVKAMEGSVMEEKGFTSTMVGDPKGRLDGYVTGSKSESLYKRFASHDPNAIYDHQDEDGAAMRVTVVLPEGTKVAPVEALRRVDHEFPKIQDPAVKDHPEWLTNADGTPNGLKASDYTIRDYTAKPIIKTDRLHDPSQRSEAEILLGSGAKFRVKSVTKAPKPVPTGDSKMKPIPVMDVVLEYIGGGSSDPNVTASQLADFQWHWLDLGGAGSGNFGHSGRPGEVGGSSEGTFADGGSEPWTTTKAQFIKSRGADAPVESDAFARHHLSKVPKGEPGLAVEGQKIVIRSEAGDPIGVTTMRTAGGQKVVDDTAVDPAHRRQGVATKLYRKAAELGYTAGYVENVASAGAKHKMAVADALAAGKVVPPEVLADYPDLRSLTYRARLSYLLGGEGSGNFGHGGRPEVGGSSSEGGSSESKSDDKDGGSEAPKGRAEAIDAPSEDARKAEYVLKTWGGTWVKTDEHAEPGKLY